MFNEEIYKTKPYLTDLDSLGVNIKNIDKVKDRIFSAIQIQAYSEGKCLVKIKQKEDELKKYFSYNINPYLQKPVEDILDEYGHLFMLADQEKQLYFTMLIHIIKEYEILSEQKVKIVEKPISVATSKEDKKKFRDKMMKDVKVFYEETKDIENEDAIEDMKTKFITELAKGSMEKEVLLKELMDEYENKKERKSNNKAED